jgi:hypothetical protein
LINQIELPLPLPADVDLSDMPFMPMHDVRLMKSKAWLLARNWRGGGPGLGFALMNLWFEAFRSVPCGSLDDDDDMLADKARCDIEIWISYKEKALRGWERHGGRLWHPVICELAWDLWQQRLSGRHEKAVRSHRMSAKRAMDKGIDPPDPPGALDDWLADEYPATFGYQAKLASVSGVPQGIGISDTPGSAAVSQPLDGAEQSNFQGVGTPDNPGCDGHKSECALNIGPKRREGKINTPLTPQQRPADTPQRGKEERRPDDRKAWFGQELRRLENEFRPMLATMLTYLQQPGVAGKYGLVASFNGCWVQRGATGKCEIVAKSKQRADAIVAQHGQWMQHYWPDIVVRHARVDELRARAAG